MRKDEKKPSADERKRKRDGTLGIDPSPADELERESPKGGFGFELDIEPVKAWDRGRGKKDDDA